MEMEEEEEEEEEEDFRLQDSLLGSKVQAEIRSSLKLMIS